MKKNELIKNIIESILPTLLMLEKLMERKQNGKKPFPAEFDYEGKYKLIDDAYLYLLDQKKSKCPSVDSETLEKIADISKESTQYIKMDSLKNDYYYLANILIDTSLYLKSIKEDK